MMIGFASARPCYPLFLGGAEISMHGTLLGLSRQGMTCVALGQATHGVRDLAAWMNEHPTAVEEIRQPVQQFEPGLPERFEVQVDVGYRVRITLHADFIDCLNRWLDLHQPEILMTQLDCAEPIIHEALRRAIRPIHMIRDVNNPENLTPYTSARVRPEQFTTICNSRFVQQSVRQRWGISSHLVYPAIDCDRFFLARQKYLDGDPHEICMVNPAESKGGGIMRRLIEMLPERQFVLVEGWNVLSRDAWPFPNVRLVRRCHDLERIFAQAALLLIPSQREEAFGRVVVEGQAAGVPVLSSRHSGLIEAHGDGQGLVEDYSNAEVWKKMICAVLDQPDLQQEMREHGWKNCRRFSIERHLDQLNEVLQR